MAVTSVTLQYNNSITLCLYSYAFVVTFFLCGIYKTKKQKERSYEEMKKPCVAIELISNFLKNFGEHHQLACQIWCSYDHRFRSCKFVGIFAIHHVKYVCEIANVK